MLYNVFFHVTFLKPGISCVKVFVFLPVIVAMAIKNSTEFNICKYSDENEELSGLDWLL